jgi:hypothetical protein
MKDSEKLKSIASIVLAIAMLVVAVIVAYIAHTANQIAQNSYEIAQKSHEIAYQANLPIISTISNRQWDETEDCWTEEIIVNNDGFPLSDFDCDAYAIMEIGSAGNKTYITLGGYYGFLGDRTGSSQGLLVTMSSKGNYSLYESIRKDFRNEASKDGYDTYIWLNDILRVSYKDYTQADWRRYFFVYSYGSSEIGIEYASEILDSASAHRELAENEGLNCYVSSLNGTELWDWYKETHLG